ncbi:hypothetical protein GGE12_006219 [Rhizobium mongolense]|uniref:Uncharacterized protein n=1 Tax=Rhizobium mongolense TaxID=57676 RepID=A0A7W6WI42_9HYPH|nr:hypothetical protein [Rhizobium mongolense]
MGYEPTFGFIDMRNYSVISSTVRGLISRRHSKRRNDSPNGSTTHKRLIGRTCT